MRRNADDACSGGPGPGPRQTPRPPSLGAVRASKLNAAADRIGSDRRWTTPARCASRPSYQDRTGRQTARSLGSTVRWSNRLNHRSNKVEIELSGLVVCCSAGNAPTKVRIPRPTCFCAYFQPSNLWLPHVHVMAQKPGFIPVLPKNRAVQPIYPGSVA